MKSQSRVRKVLMPAALFFVALAFVAETRVSADQAEHTQFMGGIGLVSPCNGEGVSVLGPVKIVYHAPNGGSQGQYSINSTFIGTGTGNQGNRYHVSAIANGHFDAPTGDFGSFQTFVLPLKLEFISQGAAPNFRLEATTTIFVVNGKAVGALISSIDSSTCHG